MSNFTVEDINNKINSFNEKVFYIEIKISNNSIHLTTLKKIVMSVVNNLMFLIILKNFSTGG